MRFRLFIFKDPDAETRGYSFRGIKVPLTTYVPIPARADMLSYDEGSAYGPYSEYWQVPVCFLVMARPSLKPHLKGLDTILVPTDWVDVAPVDSWEKLPSG